jgi:hypothetical protein
VPSGPVNELKWRGATGGDDTLAVRVDRLERMFADPTLLPGNFKQWLTTWSEVNPPTLPISQVFGFSGYVAQLARAGTGTGLEGRLSAAYGNLATVGPELSSLVDGNYLLLYGAQAERGGTSTAYMAPSVNGAAAADSAAAWSQSDTLIATVNASLAVLNAGGLNDVVMQYRSEDGVSTCQWGARWLVAFKYSEL